MFFIKKVISLETNLFGAALAFLLGAAIAWLNYRLSCRALKRAPDKFAASAPLRQLIQVAYLVALFFLGVYTPWDRVWLLVGSCLGITIPMIYFTHKLVKLNESMGRKEEDTDG